MTRRKIKYKTVRYQGAFGDTFSMEVEQLGIRTHGFNLANGGGWSLYKRAGDGSLPAQFLLYREKGKRKGHAMNFDCILNPAVLR